MTQFATAGGAGFAYGYASPIVHGPWPISAAGAAVSVGTASPISLFPEGAMTDFGIWDTNQPDAAMSRYVSGVDNIPTATTWFRSWAAVTSPTDYYSGNGLGPLMWKGAENGVLGILFPAVPNGENVNLDAVQFEVSPSNNYDASTLVNAITATDTRLDVTPFAQNYPTAPFWLILERGTTNEEIVLVNGYVAGAGAYALTIQRGVWGTTAVAHSAGAKVNYSSAPTTYEEPRKVRLYIRGDRVNYSLHPTQDLLNGAVAGATATADTNLFLYGSQSIKLQATTTTGDLWYPLDNLYLGSNTTYTWSVYVYSMVDTYIDTNNWYLQEAATPFRKAALGAGVRTVYGGKWNRVSGTGTTPANWWWSTRAIVRPARNFFNTAWDTNVPLWFSGLLIERGSAVRPYFDGNFAGADYMWEGGGPGPGLRSHFYNQFRAKQYRLDALVSDSMALGASYQIFYATQPSETPY